MNQFVIYENPSDSNSRYVVRRWKTLTKDKHPIAMEALIETDDLTKARKCIPCEYDTKIDRFIDDNPCIKEVWI